MDIERRLTSLEVELRHMSLRQDERHADNRQVNQQLKDDVKTLDGKLDGVLDILSQSKGGWKVALVVGSIVTTAGAILVSVAVWVAHWFGIVIPPPRLP